jgi:hypothetical protein
MIRLLIAAEDATGDRIARHVADLRMQQIDWVADSGLENVREWTTFEAQPWLAIRRVRDLFRACYGGSFFRVRGEFGGEPGAEDTASMRKLFLVVQKTAAPDVLIVARDVDGTDRREGFERARRSGEWSFAIVGALAQPEVEAWLICAWSPHDEQGRGCLAELRQEFGFDPVAESHRLTSTSTSRKDAKNIRGRFDAVGPDTASVFEASDVSTLRQRGEQNGLASFLRELDEKVAPRLGEHRPHS